MWRLRRVWFLIGSCALFCVSGFAAKQSPIPQNQTWSQRAYSLNDVLQFFAKRGEGRPLYLTAYDTLVRVRYVRNGPQLHLDIVPAPAALRGRGVHEILPQDPIVKTMLSGAFKASVTISTNGSVFGDDAMDQYSPLEGPLQVGTDISDEGKADCKKYMQAIGQVLATTR